MRKLRIALTVLLTMILSISMWTAVSASELINGTEKDEILEQFPENPQADTIKPEDEAKALEDTDTGISVPENTDAEMQILEDSDEEEPEKPADFYAQPES